MNPIDSTLEHGKSRKPWLDVLRCLSILLVLGAHFPVPWSEAGLFRVPAAFLARVGWSGVDFFFVVSGFLIGSLVFREVDRTGSLDFKRFFIRRALKIWPLYYICPIFLVLISPSLINVDRTQLAFELIPTFVHVQNYFPPIPSPLGHLWSLGAEEHFYLIFPLMVLSAASFGGERAKKIILAAIVLVFLASLTSRFIAVYFLDISLLKARIFSHFRFDSFMVGVFLAWLYIFREGAWERQKTRRLILTLMVLALSTPFLLNPNHSLFLNGIGYTLIALMYGSVLVLTAGFADAAIFRTFVGRSMAFVGRHSYPIYLYHVFVSRWAANHLQEAREALSLEASTFWLVTFLIYLATSIGVGVLIGEILEGPLLKVRDRIFPAKAQALG